MANTDMNNESVGATAAGFGLSYSITVLLSALLVILKELSPAVHDGLAAITGHHWVTHGLLNLIVFVVLGFVLSRSAASASMDGTKLVNYVVGSTVVSGIIIAGFFLVA